jgi:hypothetical protein
MNAAIRDWIFNGGFNGGPTSSEQLLVEPLQKLRAVWGGNIFSAV